MVREPEQADDDDDDLDDDPPRVRPWRMILSSVFGLLGTAVALLAWSTLREPRSEPQGSAAAVLQPLVSVVGWVVVVVSAIVAVVATVTLVLALREARAAGRRG